MTLCVKSVFSCIPTEHNKLIDIVSHLVRKEEIDGLIIYHLAIVTTTLHDVQVHETSNALTLSQPWH